MADVQLEYGFVRIANALYGAINLAPFSATQTRIVHALVRLTYGWDRKSVRVSHPDLAEACGYPLIHGRPGGAFRTALSELIRERVIHELEPAVGRIPAAYALNKDFEAWGRFSVSSARVETIFGERPPSIDRRPVSGPETTRPENGHPARGQAAQRPADGPGTGPVPGHKNGSKSQQHAYIEPPKDIEIQERHDATDARARVAEATEPLSSDVERYAIGLATAANNAITARWGEQPRPLVWATALSLAEDLIRMAVPLELARRAIADCVATSKLPRPPKAIAYFGDVIDDAWKRDEQRRLNAANPAPRGGRPTRAAPVVSSNAYTADRAILERKLKPEYERAQEAAVAAWLQDPSHEQRHREFVDAANADYELMLHTAWGQRMRDAQVRTLCAEAAGFPTYREWMDRAIEAQLAAADSP